jgi:hypothetical protein
MFKRLAYLAVVATLLSLFLAACGGGDNTPPAYSGGKSVTVSEEIKKQFNVETAGLKESKVEAFSTKDDLAKVKSTLSDNLGKNGWKDGSSSLGGDFASVAKQLEAVGVFFLAYEKSNVGVIYVGFPSAIAAQAGLSVPAGENLVMVFSGKK